MNISEIRELIERKDYSALKMQLNYSGSQVLSKAWPDLKPMEKALLFKLFEPAAAMEFYRGLDPNEKYFLLGAFEFGCIAPVVEDLPGPAKSLFRRLPQEYFEEMSRLLL